MGSVRIDECRAEDLERLEEAIPSGLGVGATAQHFVAWIREIGIVDILREKMAFERPDLAARLKSCR